MADNKACVSISGGYLRSPDTSGFLSNSDNKTICEESNITCRYAQGQHSHYSSIDGLRAISCIAVIAMHIRVNTNYTIGMAVGTGVNELAVTTEAVTMGVSNFLYNHFIPAFTWLVYLFLMISGFGMCAGYLRKFQGIFQNGSQGREQNDDGVDLETFYFKRYAKILPFFGFLLIIALLIEPSLTNFYEATMEVTLLYGLLPNNTMNVLGVCWTLGVIFLFYLMFPAVTVLMKSRKRAWMALAISLWINFICQRYFFGEVFVTELFTPRHSFIYCFPLFVGGGIVYLYRNEIRMVCNRFKWRVMIGCLVGTVIYFLVESWVSYSFQYYILLPLFMLWLAYAVGVDSRVLGGRCMKYLSSISMEMYLAQMIIFRLVEKCGFLYVLGTGWGGFLMTLVLTVFGLIVFIEGYKLMVRVVEKMMKRMKQK